MERKLPRYPWDKWFSQKRFRLKQGKDFRCLTHAMAIQVRAAAIKRGKQLTVKFESDTALIVTVHN